MPRFLQLPSGAVQASREDTTCADASDVARCVTGRPSRLLLRHLPPDLQLTAGLWRRSRSSSRDIFTDSDSSQNSFRLRLRIHKSCLTQTVLFSLLLLHLPLTSRTATAQNRTRCAPFNHSPAYKTQPFLIAHPEATAMKHLLTSKR
jgi:hypothetical protein